MKKHKVPTWKRLTIVLVGILFLLLCAYSIYSYLNGAQPVIVILSVGIFSGTFSLCLIFIGLKGNSKIISKVLLGLDKGISGAI